MTTLVEILSYSFSLLMLVKLVSVFPLRDFFTFLEQLARMILSNKAFIDMICSTR